MQTLSSIVLGFQLQTLNTKSPSFIMHLAFDTCTQGTFWFFHYLMEMQTFSDHPMPAFTAVT